MKRILVAILLVFISNACISQVSYYKGEWTTAGKSDLFTCTCKLNIASDNTVSIEFAWTYRAIDSTDESMMELYKGKKGMSGIEYTSGTYSPSTNDITLESGRLADPYTILGTGRYFLKLSLDKRLLYGTTEALEGGGNTGLFSAVRMDGSIGNKEFMQIKSKIRQ